MFFVKEKYSNSMEHRQFKCRLQSQLLCAGFLVIFVISIKQEITPANVKSAQESDWCLVNGSPLSHFPQEPQTEGKQNRAHPALPPHCHFLRTLILAIHVPLCLPGYQQIKALIRKYEDSFLNFL